MIINDCVLDLENSMELEPAATPWYDISRYKNNGTITAGAGGWVQLPSGLWVYNFDGAASIIACGNDDSLSLTTAFTMMAWINPTGFGENGVGAIFSKNYITDWILATWNDGNQRLYLGGVSKIGGAFVLGVWQFWAVTWDLASTNIHFFINGVEVAPGGTYNVVLPTNNTILYIGNRVATDRTFDGFQGHHQLLNYNLTAGQIRNYFEKTKYLFGVA